MKFRLIPPGEFLMGSTPEEIEAALDGGRRRSALGGSAFKSEAPQHKVILTQPVYVGVTEVTQAQYEQVMGTNPSHFSASGEGKEAVAGLETGNHPVEKVSWNDAAEFCAKLSQQEELKPFYFRSGETVTPLEGTGYRLPTEAEWEFACRAGTTTRFWSGDEDNDLVSAGWFGSNSEPPHPRRGRTESEPVRACRTCMATSGNGCRTAGIRRSMASSRRIPQSIHPAHCPPAPSGWSAAAIGATTPSYCRSSFRHPNHPSDRFGNLGFRVVLMVDAVRGGTAASPQPVTDATDPYARDRAAAEWVISVGGSLHFARRERYPVGGYFGRRVSRRVISFMQRSTHRW